MEEHERIRLFKEKAEAVETVVADISELRQAFRYAIEITQRQGGSMIAAPGLEHRQADAPAMFHALCADNGLTLVTEHLRSAVGKLHTGFTIVDYGIAETATLVQDSSSEDVRIATMLSEIHIAVLPAARIRLDAMALAGELRDFAQAAPRYLAFISGAGRTADIERVLTIGVHGPQQLHVLILAGELRC